MCNDDAIEALLLEKARLLKRITELHAEVHAKQAHFLHLLQRETLDLLLETTEETNLLTFDRRLTGDRA